MHYEMCYNPSMKSDAVLNMRIPADLKDALQRAADQNLRTMSSMATWALAEWLTEHGFLDRPSPTASSSRRKSGR